jgi:hypothetical protein
MKPLTSLDEERLSRRLIAQLAEEEDWDASLAAAAGARFDDEDDEDYAPKVGGSRKRKGTQLSKKIARVYQNVGNIGVVAALGETLALLTEVAGCWNTVR